MVEKQDKQSGSGPTPKEIMKQRKKQENKQTEKLGELEWLKTTSLPEQYGPVSKFGNLKIDRFPHYYLNFGGRPIEVLYFAIKTDPYKLLVMVSEQRV